ncbi:MAG: ribosome hibernation-promoting factor, HPF/YfiA family [Candidatus Bipolaricaulota bacterium]|nr:ribosome-associated translation inhibitor RaiA [Candidatus Bipolaricaulota bacterium]
MKVKIEERHMEQSEPLRDYAISKAGDLEKFFDGIISVEVTMDVEKKRRTVKIFAHLINKKIVKASAESDDMYVSIDSAIDKIERQLKKYNEKLKDKHKGEIDDAVSAGPDPGANQATPNIVKTDIYFKKPMSPDEAVLQLDSYHQNFLVFLNSKSDVVNIIYERDDGQYGLIEPQF